MIEGFRSGDQVDARVVRPYFSPLPVMVVSFLQMVLRTRRSLRTLRSGPLISKSLQTLQMRDVKMSVFYGAVC